MQLFVGNNYEIGKAQGKYWGDYFHEIASPTFYRDYKSWLTLKKISPKQSKLLFNMVNGFPNLLHELVGMTAGINESKIGFQASLIGVFSCWLAESDIDYEDYDGGGHCSSFIKSIGTNGKLLGHSEENEKPYPILSADVTLINNDKKSVHFQSFSYPFQLLGSAGGMNNSFAFQGNSIGCSEEIFDMLNNTPDNRIFKTIFTRMMLEMSSKEQILKLYKKYPSTLPNHHYVMKSNIVHSINIKPAKGINIVTCIRINNQTQANHTNHFLDDENDFWQYTDADESTNRLQNLDEYIDRDENWEDNFINYLNNYDGLINRTSGIFFFTAMTDQPLRCSANIYDERTKELNKISLRSRP